MKISIEHFSGAHPQFNVALSSKEGVDPFITIKGCRIVSGRNGDFVSWPATKQRDSDKYWQHVWASEAFANAVLDAAKASMPASAPRPSRQTRDDDIPF